MMMMMTVRVWHNFGVNCGLCDLLYSEDAYSYAAKGSN